MQLLDRQYLTQLDTHKVCRLLQGFSTDAHPLPASPAGMSQKALTRLDSNNVR